MVPRKADFVLRKWISSRWFMAPHGDADGGRFTQRKKCADRKIGSRWCSIGRRLFIDSRCIKINFQHGNNGSIIDESSVLLMASFLRACIFYRSWPHVQIEMWFSVWNHVIENLNPKRVGVVARTSAVQIINIVLADFIAPNFTSPEVILIL